MKKEIKTSRGIYTYQPVMLYYGRKLIDIQVSKQNLLDVKQLLDVNRVPFGIIYGTLLGAVREQNFLAHDDDVDTFILDENREKLLALLFEFRKIGFEVARYEGDVLSIIRNDDYIDIYVFRKNIFGNRVCNGDSLNSKYLETFDRIDFLGAQFNTPKNYISFLEKAYGRNWRIPKKNSPAEVKGRLAKIVKLVKRFLPARLIKLLQQINKRTLKIR